MRLDTTLNKIWQVAVPKHRGDISYNLGRNLKSLGICEKTYYKFKNGKHDPRYSTLKRMLEGTGYKLDVVPDEEFYR